MKKVLPFSALLLLIIAFARLHAIDIAPGTRTAVTDAAVISLGEEQTILPRGSFGLIDFPSDGVQVLQTKPFRGLIGSHGLTFLAEGSSLTKIDSCIKVLEPGGKGSIDNGFISVSGVFRRSDGYMYGICRILDYEDLPEFQGGTPGYYGRISLVQSKDGISWTKLGSVIESSTNKQWSAFKWQCDRGIGENCLTIDRTGKYVLVYYTEHSRVDNRGVQICVARASLSDRKSPAEWWKKFYKGSFSQPGLGGKDTPVMSVAYKNDADAMSPDVKYSPKIGRYIMIFTVNMWREEIKKIEAAVSGVYVSDSIDGIRWSEPKKLITDYGIISTGRATVWRPTIVFDKGSYTDGWLVYGRSTSWGFSSGNQPCYMAGRRIHIERKNR